jgi:hypothetical protein
MYLSGGIPMDTLDGPSWDGNTEEYSASNYEVEERLPRYEKEFGGWEKYKTIETSMQELHWFSTGNSVFWFSIAVVYANKAKFAAVAAGLQAEHGVAAVLKRQARFAVIDKTGSGKLPVCISTTSKARMCLKKIKIHTAIHMSPSTPLLG